MEGIFTRNAYCKFETDCTDFAPPKTVFALTVYCGKTQRINGGKNGISKQFEKLEAYGWEAAS